MESSRKVALVTGSSQRIGAAIVRSLHAKGMDVAVHYRNSASQADDLEKELNELRPGSARTFQADLTNMDAVDQLGNRVVSQFGQLDVLVNNASVLAFDDGQACSIAQYQELVGIHIGAPYYLAWAVIPALKKSKGCVINITDIYAQKPNNTLALYSATKAALESMTKAFALQFAPEVRFNAIAPGAILWPEQSTEKESILEQTPLGRLGTVDEIAKSVNYLVFEATFTTGQVLIIDGGRMINTP